MNLQKINNLQNEIEKYLDENNNEITIFRATLDILKTNNILKLNFFSLGIRELIRIFLSNNIQESDIKQCIWYPDYIEYNNLEEEIITRKQRMLYAVYGGLNLKEVKQYLGIDIEDKIKQLLSEVNKLNSFSHIENHIIKNENDIIEKVIKILITFKEFLEKLSNFRNDFSFKYEQFISKIMTDKFANEVIKELDNKATHYENPYFNLDEIKLQKLDSSEIILFVTGSTSVLLQYGSDYDNRAGNGLRIEQNYITTFNISFKTVEAFNINISNIQIENLEIIDDND